MAKDYSTQTNILKCLNNDSTWPIYMLRLLSLLFLIIILTLTLKTNEGQRYGQDWKVHGLVGDVPGGRSAICQKINFYVKQFRSRNKQNPVNFKTFILKVIAVTVSDDWTEIRSSATLLRHFAETANSRVCVCQTLWLCRSNSHETIAKKKLSLYHICGP